MSEGTFQAEEGYDHEQSLIVGNSDRVDQLESSLMNRISIAAIHSAALAYDEIFSLKQELALAREPERKQAEISRDINQVALLRISEAERVIAQQAIYKSEMERKLKEQSRRAKHFEMYCNELLSSSSWRVTAPLRAIVNLLKRS